MTGIITGHIRTHAIFQASMIPFTWVLDATTCSTAPRTVATVRAGVYRSDSDTTLAASRLAMAMATAHSTDGVTIRTGMDTDPIIITAIPDTHPMLISGVV